MYRNLWRRSAVLRPGGNTELMNGLLKMVHRATHIFTAAMRFRGDHTILDVSGMPFRC